MVPAGDAAEPRGVLVDVEAPADEADPVPDERRERNRRLQSTLEWAAVVVGALVVALVVKTFLFQAFYIPSASMEPTLEKGDRVLVNSHTGLPFPRGLIPDARRSLRRTQRRVETFQRRFVLFSRFRRTSP